jgi:hypothetical protein
MRPYGATLADLGSGGRLWTQRAPCEERSTSTCSSGTSRVEGSTQESFPGSCAKRPKMGRALEPCDSGWQLVGS